MLFTHAISALRLEHLRNVISLILWWSVLNNLGLLDLDPNLLVLWVGLFPQWEIQDVAIDVTFGVLVLL